MAKHKTCGKLIMNNTLYGTDIISIADLQLDQINHILKTAAQLKAKPAPDLLQHKIIANCFFEPSTRTRLSFETAALRLGARVIGFSDAENTSIKKGESLHDSIKIIANYADLIVIRHTHAGAARLAADVANKPVINAGDAANQHPTQALLDLFTIKECQQKIAGLNIALTGDLKYGRTIHSLIQLLALFDIRLFLIAPEALSLSEQFANHLKKKGIKFSFHQSIEDVIHKLDILYMTRIQQERFTPLEYQTFTEHYALNPACLHKAKPNLKILHPLPRVNEIPMSIDNTPHAYYFEQAANGIWVRQALLNLLLNK